MQQWLAQLAPLVKLTRVTTAFAAVGNVWFTVLWTRGFAEEGVSGPVMDRPLALLLFGGMLVGVGLFAFGACLNDVLDFHRDRLMHPDRPIASGDISLETASLTVAATLLVAILGSTAFGTRAVLLTIVLAAAIVLFNAIGKFVPAVGALTLGVIYAGHMLVPNPEIRFLWPAWLVMTHALAVSGLTRVLARKPPPWTRRAVVAAFGGWLLVTALLAWLQHQRSEGWMLWVDWVPLTALAWPAILVVVYVWIVWRRIRQFGPTARAADKIWRYGTLWLTLYVTAWLFASGLTTAGLILAGLAACGFFGMTFLREMYAMVDQPVGYRR